MVAFREELSGKGLVKFYAGAREFPDVVRRDLILLLGRMLKAGRTPADAAERLARLTRPKTWDDLDRRIEVLAGEYSRVRDTMPPGHPRTRQMEVIASRMRALAGQLYSSVPLLSAADGPMGDAPGRRLAAITFLQAIPHPGYLQWLSERFGRDRVGEEVEKPFVQYHAGVALLSAVRVLGATHKRELQLAIDQALGRSAYLSRRTDRYRVLEEAASELEQT